ncbi:MAG: glycosyltransferase [Candidatus Gottesmanbacteria bacterium]|nr:glycosyltransferase [Candidatus Gottesmanbacteria bacterium]
MRVALVYDRVNKWGGAERVLLALHEIWPEAPLYTAVYDSAAAGWADVFTVRPSFLQYVPFAKHHHEWFPWATPMAFESFSFDDYDVVISVTSAEAKYIITKPSTLHICYCLTPTRYLWSGYEEYARSSKLLTIMAPVLRRWDIVGASRPDYYIAISARVQARIEKYYGRSVEKVIYPPVDTDKSKVEELSKGYFLVVSRLVSYKRIDLIIDAFNALRLPLVIVGSGHEEKLLRALASDTISFVSSHLTETQLHAYYGRCRAFLSAADEDFGVAAAEAQAAGIPVIAYAQSGTAEIIVDGVTGILFQEQTVQGIIHGVKRFMNTSIRSQACIDRASRFRKERFTKEMKETVNKLYNNYKRNNDFTTI